MGSLFRTLIVLRESGLGWSCLYHYGNAIMNMIGNIIDLLANWNLVNLTQMDSKNKFPQWYF